MNILSQLLNDFGHIGMAELGIIFAVIVMDAALSGDNSIAISAMARDLPEKLRNKTVWLGMVLAAFLRLVALGFATFIMKNPWVQILGGLYLIYLCVSHFRKEEIDEAIGHKSRKSFLAVLVAIGFLDLSLSLDNVIAVVAMSKNMAVIVFGVIASIAMLAVATQIVQKVMKRYKNLEPAAYVILAFLGFMMLAEHSSEFLLWVGERIAYHHDTVAKFHFSIGETGEIFGVGAIVTTAILLEEMNKRRKSKHHIHTTESTSIANL